jgi:hypothetical protein
MSQTVYAYQDVNRVTKMVDTGDINYTGTWSSSGTYFEATKDVVLYGSSRFIAIVDNVGGVPTYIPRRGQAKWSSLVVIRQGTETGHTADEAWTLANTANDAAAAATVLANQALAAAWAGTAASVPISGGTMTGNLRTPQIFLGAGTTATAQAINGTVYYDFLGPAFQETTVDADIMVSAKNYTPGAEISAILISNGAQRTLSYDAAFSWFGTQVPFMSPVADKKVLVALASAGTTPAKVIGASTPQI